MTLTRLIAAAAALSIGAIVPTDAVAKQKRYKAQRVVVYPAEPYGTGTARPPWAQPWECFTDEGYGRYRSCSSGAQITAKRLGSGEQKKC
jgi:hypothetical protein